MTPSQVIKRVNAVKPNGFPVTDLLGFLTQVEQQLAQERPDLRKTEFPYSPKGVYSVEELGTVKAVYADERWLYPVGEESGKNGYWEKEGSVVVRSPSFSTLTIYDLPGVEPFSVETMDTRSLLLKEQWADIYVHYLCAQMELYSGNLSMYANHAALFNQRFSEYVRLLYDNRPAAPKACTVFRNIE